MEGVHRRSWGWRRRRQRGVLIEWLSRRPTPLSAHPVYVWVCVRIRETCACACVCVCVCVRVDAYVATDRRASYIQSASRKMIRSHARETCRRWEKKKRKKETSTLDVRDQRREIWGNNLGSVCSQTRNVSFSLFRYSSAPGVPLCGNTLRKF